MDIIDKRPRRTSMLGSRKSETTSKENLYQNDAFINQYRIYYLNNTLINTEIHICKCIRVQ